MRAASLFALLLIVGASSPALAEDTVEISGSVTLTPPEAAPTPTNAPSTSPPPAPVVAPPASCAPPAEVPAPESAPKPHGVHLHDGLYLRFGIGGGMVASRGTFEPALVLGGDKVRGGGVAIDTMLGGAVRPGLSIGGAVLVQEATRPRLTWDSGATEPGNDVSFGLVGPFVDWHVDPRGGFHVGALLGVAIYETKDGNTGSQVASEQGYGVAPHVGYDFWIGEQWSMGVLARGLYAGTSAAFSDGSSSKHSTVGGSLLLSFLYQ